MYLSIIIPVYNIEYYLPTCIHSILNQDFKDYELLLINDGSTDNSGKICDTYAAEDGRIKVFHQQNAGVSAARNLGLDRARGEWVCFIDGDDQIEDGSLYKIMQKAKQGNPEIIFAKSYHFEEQNKLREKYPFDSTFLERKYGGYELITTKFYRRGSVCGGIFKRSFFERKQLRFPAGLKNGEDSIFISLCYCYAEKIRFAAIDFYLVTEREGSASRSWSFERVYKMVDNIHFVNVYIDNHPKLGEEQRSILYYAIYGTVSVIFNYLYFCFSLQNYLKTARAVRKELRKKIDTGGILLNKRKVKLLNFSLNLFSMSVLFNQMFRQLSK